MGELTHIDAAGNAKMVDVTGKEDSRREATAAGRVRMKPATFELIKKGGVVKGDVLAAAKAEGLRVLREDGWMKVRKGVTTPEEVIRATKA